MVREKLYSVQYLRGLAAILVVYVHAVGLQISAGGVSFQQNFYSLNSIGNCGVDLFFVISGFIICYISSEESGVDRFKRFITKRFIRINPVFYVASLLMLICLIIWSPGEYTFDTILKSIVILPIFDSDEFVYPLIYVGWTLSYEWTFYLFYGLFIALSIVKRREIYLISIFFILFLLGFFFPLRETHYIFITNPMFLEFCLGMMAAIAYRRIKHVNAAIPIIVGLLGIAFFVFLIINGHGKVHEAWHINNGVYTWHRFFVFGIPSLFVFISFLFLEKRTSLHFIKSNKLALLGDASYSIYLIHPVLFFVLHYTVGKHLSIIPPDLLIILLVALSIALGIVFHKLVENRLISFFSGLLLSNKTKVQER